MNQGVFKMSYFHSCNNNSTDFMLFAIHTHEIEITYILPIRELRLSKDNLPKVAQVENS